VSTVDRLEAMLEAGRDSALLRFGLGSEYRALGDLERALTHFAAATEMAPAHSAAWKLHGRTLADLGRYEEAVAVFTTGIGIAEENGDLQAVKEMQVFRRRALRQSTAGGADAGSSGSPEGRG